MFSYSYDNMKRISETERGKSFMAMLESEYIERYKDKPIYALDYSKFKRFYVDGNRNEFEEEYFDRRKRLSLLQALAVYDEKYLEDLENIISAICDEFMWVLPAHAFENDVAKYEQIDLFSAETALYLAETAYVYGDKLTKDIRNKISVSIKQKIVTIFENGNLSFEKMHTNWAAVCGCGVGLAYLYSFPERLPAVKDRIFACMETYLSGICEDGYCEEGVGYCEYGFGFFAIFFDVYTQLTGDCPEILTRKKVLNLLEFATNANMADDIYLPFADGGSPKYTSYAEITYTFKNLFGDAFDLLPMKTDLSFSKALQFRTLNGIDKFGEYQEKTFSEETIYYKEGQVFIRKEKNYAFAVKCGTNYEIHNHNDIGTFQIVRNGKRLITDFGAGEYTSDYFRNPKERYGEKIFVCGSMSHSVPIIGGEYQRPGRPYCGEVISQSEREIVMDIAGAYEENAHGMMVKYVVEQDKIRVIYRNLNDKSVRYRFTSEYKPKITENGVMIEDMQLCSANKLSATITEKVYSNHQCKPTKAYLIDFEVPATDKEIEFYFSFL